MLLTLGYASFCFSFICIVYTYMGYPLLIRWRGSRAKRTDRGAEIEPAAASLPTISIVTAIHNGGHEVETKLHNVLQELAYPAELLEWILVDDGSTDDTIEVIERYIETHKASRVRLLRQPERRGKPAALNLGVAHASHELLVFCDVRQRIEAQALQVLVSYFADPKVGCVSGALEMDSAQGPGVYWRYERAIRMAESQLGVCVGATGALFVIRRKEYQPIPEDSLLDDVFTPMQIALKGYSIHMAEAAKVYDKEADVGHEFSRKVRTLAGNFQLLAHLPALLSPRANPLFFSFVSHKLLRLCCPYALLTLLASSLYLWAQAGPLALCFGVFACVQLICYTAALVAAVSGKGGKFGAICKTFVVLNVAAVVGAKRALMKQWRWSS